MNGLMGSGTSALIERLQDGLRSDFPDWQIGRECSGRWVAKRPRWGALYGQSATELRNRLDRFAGSGDAR